MFFCNNNHGEFKIINKRVLQSVRLNQKHLDKKRNLLLNSADAWRKKIHFPNMLSKNSFSWVFKLKFSMFVLFNNHCVLENRLTPFLKNNVSIFYKNLPLAYSKFFVMLTYNNYFLYFHLDMPSAFLNNSLIFLNKNSSSVSICNFFFFWINAGLLGIVKRWFSCIEKSVYNYIFLKLRYKGKNHRWHRKKKGLVLRFGHSHLISLKKPVSVFLKKKGRMKILFFGTNIELLYFFLRNIVNWKPANVYTGRGLRISRQRILRKSGKVSIYR